MAVINLSGSRTAAQFATALVLLLTFSVGMKTGRHIANETWLASLESGVSALGPHFPYQLGEPVRKLALPAVLEEASAVSYIDGAHVGMVQDEHGVLYIYSLLENRIINEVPFADSGDYEGLVVLGREAWVLKSDGDLLYLPDTGNTRLPTVKLENFLRASDDTEGLAIDRNRGQLLIGLKETPRLGDKRRKDKRAVFAFDIQQQTLLDKPYLLLDMAEIKRVYQAQVGGSKADKFNLKQKKSFQPSGLAVHPLTGHIYHIAARGQLLVVSDHSGLIHFVRPLPKTLFRQPEGISFDPRGNMFIVNEGAGSSAILLEFQYKPMAPRPEPAPQSLKFGLSF